MESQIPTLKRRTSVEEQAELPKLSRPKSAEELEERTHGKWQVVAAIVALVVFSVIWGQSRKPTLVQTVTPVPYVEFKSPTNPETKLPPPSQRAKERASLHRKTVEWLKNEMLQRSFRQPNGEMRTPTEDEREAILDFENYWWVASYEKCALIVEADPFAFRQEAVHAELHHSLGPVTQAVVDGWILKEDELAARILKKRPKLLLRVE